MSTKINPGEFDVFRAALPDEPHFILLARDRSAPDRVREWADKLRKQLVAEKLARPAYDEEQAWLDRYNEDMAKCRDADMIAHDMQLWRANNEGVWRNPSERPPYPEISPALRDFIAEITKARLCSFLIIGTGQITQISHDVRNWTMPGFACRVHTLTYESTSDAFAKIVNGADLEMTDWHVSGFDVALGDVSCAAADANHLWLQLQTVGD